MHLVTFVVVINLHIQIGGWHLLCGFAPLLLLTVSVYRDARNAFTDH